MKKIFKYFIMFFILVVICIVLDLACVFTMQRPIFAVKNNSSSEDIVYKGLLYNTYICNQYSGPQIKFKWEKYSCYDTNKTFEIVDTTEVCAEALEGIYEKNGVEYYLPCIKSQNITIVFSDGTKYSLREVLNEKILTIEELIENGLEVYVY